MELFSSRKYFKNTKVNGGRIDTSMRSAELSGVSLLQSSALNFLMAAPNRACHSQPVMRRSVFITSKSEPSATSVEQRLDVARFALRGNEHHIPEPLRPRGEPNFSPVGLAIRSHSELAHVGSVPESAEYFFGGQLFTTELSAFAHTSPSGPANVLGCSRWD